MNRAFVLFLLFFIPAVSSAVEPSMDLYQKLLSEYVKPGKHHGALINRVNYSALGKDPEFRQLEKMLDRFSPEQLEGKQEKTAFYINAYNILAIKVVLDNWPVKSIKDAGSFFKPVWKKTAGAIGGRKISLDEIEHRILRPMGDPRIHMSIVCASLSCPDLRTEPYTAEKLSRQMDEQALSFLANTQKGLRIEGDKVRVSRIFDWFEKDFVKAYGSVNAFISHYVSLPAGAEIKPDLPYNWSLNGQ